MISCTLDIGDENSKINSVLNSGILNSTDTDLNISSFNINLMNNSFFLLSIDKSSV